VGVTLRNAVCLRSVVAASVKIEAGRQDTMTAREDRCHRVDVPRMRFGLYRDGDQTEIEQVRSCSALEQRVVMLTGQHDKLNKSHKAKDRKWPMGVGYAAGWNPLIM
jgi:hypothetical protein